MKHLHMALGFHVERLVHRRAVHEDRHVPIQYIHLFLRIRYHRAGRPDARNADDDTSHEECGTDGAHQLNLVFQILNDHFIFC